MSAQKEAPTTRSIMDDIRARALTARDAFLETLAKPGAVETKVKRRLADHLDAIILHTVGAVDRWGEWRFEHNSPILDEIRNRVRDEAVRLVTEAMADGKLVLTKGMKDQIRRQYREEILNEASRIIQRRADEDLIDVVAEVLADVESTFVHCQSCGVRHQEPLHD